MSQALVQLHPNPNFEKFLIQKIPQKMYSISNIFTWNHSRAKARTQNESRPSFVVQGTGCLKKWVLPIEALQILLVIEEKYLCFFHDKSSEEKSRRTFLNFYLGIGKRAHNLFHELAPCHKSHFESLLNQFSQVVLSLSISRSAKRCLRGLRRV